MLNFDADSLFAMWSSCGMTGLPFFSPSFLLTLTNFLYNARFHLKLPSEGTFSTVAKDQLSCSFNQGIIINPPTHPYHLTF